MSSTITQYRKRLQPAIQCIEDAVNNLETRSVKELAETCFISPFHFHRIYRLLIGETCQQTLTRLRLIAATETMKDKSLSVTDIAQKTGYSSSQALAKKLKQHTGSTASELRSDEDRLSETIKILSVPDGVSHESFPVSLELTQLSPMKIMTIETNGRYPQLNQTYHELFNAVGDPTLVKAILGQPGANQAYLEEDNSLFSCGLLLNEINHIVAKDNISVKKIPSGHYVRIRHTGSYNTLEMSLDSLYLSLLSMADCQFSDCPCLFHYLDDPEETEVLQLRTDIYVPVML